MTYFGVLLRFVIPPMLLFVLWAWYDARHGRALMGAGFMKRHAWRVIFVHVGMALAYTTPWDNYLVATNVWWYDPNLVTGITLWYVPIEEYTFFVVQTLMTGTWMLTLSRYAFPKAPHFQPKTGLRYVSVAAMGIMFLASAVVLLTGWSAGTYLALTLGWAALPFTLQLAFGADILLSRLRYITVAIFVPTFYLCVIDAIAISSGTWTIDPAQTTGILLGGILPLEEAVFFMVTNILVVFGVTLMMDENSQHRAQKLLANARRKRGHKEMQLHGEPQ